MEENTQNKSGTTWRRLNDESITIPLNTLISFVMSLYTDENMYVCVFHAAVVGFCVSLQTAVISSPFSFHVFCWRQGCFLVSQVIKIKTCFSKLYSLSCNSALTKVPLRSCFSLCPESVRSLSEWMNPITLLVWSPLTLKYDINRQSLLSQTACV